MQLKRFSCKTGCGKKDLCGNMPLEIHGGSKEVDILIVTEFPGKKEVSEKQFLIGKFGAPFRNIMTELESKYKFSWGLTGLFKAQSYPEEINIIPDIIKVCAKQTLRKEIEYTNPKVIIALGESVYEFIHSKKLPFGMFVEDGRMEKVKVFGIEREVMFSIHPNWHVNQHDSCAIGFLYENIRKAVDFAINGVDWRIQNYFETNLITTLPQLKAVLKDIKNTKSYCAVDTETRNLNRVYDNEVLSIQLCNDGKVGHVIPLDHFDSPFKDCLPKALSYIHNFFFKSPTQVPGYIWVNPKFDYHQLFRTFKTFSMNAPNLDISFGAYTLEENWTRVFGFPKQKGVFTLFTLAYKSNFDFYMETSSKEKRDRLAHLPLKEWVEYGAADVVAPWQLYQRQLLLASRTNYKQNFIKLNNIFHNHMNRATTYVEHCGLAINFNTVENLVKKNSILNRGITEVMNQFYQLPSVKEANEKLVQEEIGVTASGLFGDTQLWNPSKNLHRELLYFDVMKLEPIDTEDEESTTTGKEFQTVYAGIKEVDLLAEFNALSKLKSGFVNPLYKWMNKTSSEARADLYEDFRARGFFLTDAVTGRLKCIKPNGQQRPARGKYAKQLLSMYEPRNGRVIIKLDYSTFEVRGLGFISEDSAMIKSFQEMHRIKDQFRKNPMHFVEEGYKVAMDLFESKKEQLKKKKKELKDYLDNLPKEKRKKVIASYKEEVKEYKEKVAEAKERKKTNPISFSQAYLKFLTDFHIRSAALFHEIDIANVTDKQRQGAKNLVFGGIYGRGIQSIAKVLSIAEDAARKLYEAFMNAMPEAVNWLNQMKKIGREQLYVESPIGRRRRLWGHLYTNKGIMNKMDRYAMNTIIQGVCSDLNLIAASLLIYFIEAHGKAKYQCDNKDAWYLTMLIHDSTEMEVPVQDAYYVLTMFESIFTSLLEYYMVKVFNFEIKVPTEVDFTVGTNYGNTKDWNGSKIHAEELQAWLIDEVAKRDSTPKIPINYALNNPFFKSHGKKVLHQVIKDAIKQDRKYMQ